MIIHTNTESGILNIEDSLSSGEWTGGDEYQKVFRFNSEAIFIISDKVNDQCGHRILLIDFIPNNSSIDGYHKMKLEIPSGYLKICEENEVGDKNTYLLYPCTSGSVTIHFKDGIAMNQTNILIEREDDRIPKNI